MDSSAGTFFIITRNHHGWKGAVELLLRQADVGFSFCDSVYDCLARIYSVRNIENLCVIGDGEILSADNGKFIEFCEKKNIKCFEINGGDLSSLRKQLNIQKDESTEQDHRISEEEISALFGQTDESSV